MKLELPLSEPSKNVGLHEFEQLLMIFVDGLKYFYGENDNEKLYEFEEFEDYNPPLYGFEYDKTPNKDLFSPTDSATDLLNENNKLQGIDHIIKKKDGTPIRYVFRFHLSPGLTAVKTMSGNSVLIQISKNKSLIFTMLSSSPTPIIEFTKKLC